MAHNNDRTYTQYVSPRQAGLAVKNNASAGAPGDLPSVVVGPHGLESTSDATIPPAVAYMPEGYNGVLRDIDYFRRSCGYYWTWTSGATMKFYSEFRPINEVLQLGQNSGQTLAAFQIQSVVGLPEEPVIFGAFSSTGVGAYEREAWEEQTTTGYLDPAWWAEHGLGRDEHEVSAISADSYTNPDGGTITITPSTTPTTWEPYTYHYQPIGAPGGFFVGPLTEVKTITLKGTPGRWPAQWPFPGASAQEHLFNEPYWTVWQTYMLGSANLQVSNTAAAMANDIPGVLGSFTMANGGMNGDGTGGRRGYRDYTFKLDVPPRAVVATALYNYYSPSLENTDDGAGSFAEVALPNLYATLSIATDPGDPSSYLFGDGSAGVYSYTPGAAVQYQLRCTHLGSTTALGRLGPAGPIGYSEIADVPGLPNNLLSTIAANNPNTADANELAWVARANKDVGLGNNIVRYGRLNQMTAMNGPWPFGVRLQIQCDQSSGLLNLSAGELGLGHASALQTRRALTDFFLYEIMLANLNNYGENTVLGNNAASNPSGMSTEQWATNAATSEYNGGWLQIYERMPMDSDRWGDNVNTTRLYGGFGWMPDSDWDPDNAIARRGYQKSYNSKLRTIDIKHLFESSDDQIARPYRDHWGLGCSGRTGLNKAYGVWGSADFSIPARGTMIGTSVSSKDVTLAASTPVHPNDLLASNGGLESGTSQFKRITQALSSYAHNRMRNYEDMITGLGCYHEPLCYKITKWQVDSETGASISELQRIYIPAVGDSETGVSNPDEPYTINYFDTQVKYNQTYAYDVSAYHLVVGNEYNYTDREVFPGPPTAYPSNLGAQLGFNSPGGATMGPGVAGGDPGLQEVANAAHWPQSGPAVDVTLFSGNGAVGGLGNSWGNEPGESINDDDIEGNRIWLRNRGIAVAPFRRAYSGKVTQPLNPVIHSKIATWKTGYLGDVAYMQMPYSAVHPFHDSDPFVLDTRIGSPSYVASALQPEYAVEHAGTSAPARSIELTHLLESMNVNATEIATRFVCDTNMNNWYTGGTHSSGGSGTFVLAHIPSIRYLSDYDKEQAIIIIARVCGVGSLFGAVLHSTDPTSTNYALGPDVTELPFYAAFAAAGTVFSPGTPAARRLVAFNTPEAFDWYFGIPQWLDRTPGSFWPLVKAELTFAFDTGQHGMNPPVPTTTADAGTARFQVNNYGSLKIVEVPYGSSEIINVHDLPPMWPDAEFYPLMGVSNKVKILLNQFNTSDEFLPVVIKPSDINTFNQMRRDQGKAEDEPILFGGDDSAIRFEVYRLEQPPISYADFKNARHKVLQTQRGHGEAEISVTAASMMDDIVPNVIYYYCFRTIDKGEYMSNPSPVIKIQIVDNNGRIYFINEPYEMIPPLRGKREKLFKRYLEIGASVAEKKIETTVAGGDSAGSPAADAECIVGEADGVMRNPQNKSLKIRLTGKDTGRKLDLNVKFDIERITNPKYGDN